MRSRSGERPLSSNLIKICRFWRSDCLGTKPHQVDVTPWISSKHNMGFAYNRTTWESVVRCAQHFCSYDDYNWDWSLQHVSQQCLRNKLHAMVVKGPRVFHIGEW